jgi:hypothetical protein
MLKLAVIPLPVQRRLLAIAAAFGIAVLIAAGVLLVQGGAPTVWYRDVLIPTCRICATASSTRRPDRDLEPACSPSV